LNAGEPHPHELRAEIADRLPPHLLRPLTTLEPGRALAALAVEWLAIAAAIAGTAWVGWPWLYPLAWVFIGARQAALTVIAHDAAHFRLLPSRFWNDVIGGLFAAWPTFLTLPAFRRHHGQHHQHLGESGDGNRFIWRTHDQNGHLRAEWTYPKSPAALAWKLLRRSLFFTGLRWMVLGTLAQLVFRSSLWEVLGRAVYLAAVAAALTATGAWKGFLLYWVIPFCTWHMAAQYVRLICEHSRVPTPPPGGSPIYALTRTTLARPWERLLIVPRNIGYHIEHHSYPMVPFYKLPDLHRTLMEQPSFASRAVVSRSIVESLGQVLTRARPPGTTAGAG
jgi:fatty acid desaturase